MTNKEKLIAIIGEEDFRKLERNFDPTYDRFETLDELVEIRADDSIYYAFEWNSTPEYYLYWSSLNAKLKKEWGDVSLTKITNEEHDLLFKMFVMEWMGYPQRNHEDWYNLLLADGVGLKVYEALKEE